MRRAKRMLDFMLLPAAKMVTTTSREINLADPKDIHYSIRTSCVPV